MSQGSRVLGGKPYFNRRAVGTLIKLRTGKVRIITSSRNWKTYVPFVPVHLPEASMPKRDPDTAGRGELGRSWMTGAEWFYGGAGHWGTGCICWHSRFTMDYFDRSYVPEPDLFSVAVLDSAGNLILRVGQYGNADDGVPMRPGRATPVTRNRLGSDEVAVFYPAFVGADTDRRLFIADVGNLHISSVKLGYHATEKIHLRNVPDQAGKAR
jgi:hypothetical protein